MRERSLEEFESIFERASIPVLDVETESITRISALLDAGSLDASILSLANYLKARFDGEVLLHYPQLADVEETRAIANRYELQPATEAFASDKDVLGQIAEASSQLVIVPASADKEDRGVSIDTLVRECLPPVLIVHEPIARPGDVFERVLHNLTGNFQQRRNFTCSFTLVAPQGELLLLHTIAATELEGVRESLRMAPDVGSRGEAELLEALTHHGERYLKAVVAASQQHDFEVQYRLAIGDVLPTVQQELSRGRYGLLVVGQHHEDRSAVAADVYQLMHLVEDIPVLAL